MANPLDLPLPHFQEDLRAIINKHSLDNACNTPDFILAEMIAGQIEAYRKAVAANISWHDPSAIGQAGRYSGG